ncbi:MAG TPA: hypothetical protein P5519_02860 [Spirochaetia bacterium]|nr:hypothetical protein [Spirochaetales bacterium]HPD79476.1 hypothetical protein [Spirochaetales bacterium]HRS64811.1 hypothetical protein [Spirochaetia bacterium]HRV27673.1 hypothetical protein [Spirochaetia bacterium]
MIVELFSVCDFAQDVMGKLTLVGVFDSISVKNFPAVHPLLSIAIRIRYTIFEQGKHDVRIEIKDTQNRELVPAFQSSITISAMNSDSVCTNLTLNLMNLKFDYETTWRITLFIDAQERANIPLYIRKA